MSKLIVMINILFLSVVTVFCSASEGKNIKKEEKEKVVVIKETSKQKSKIYKYTDSNGIVHYTDDPSKGKEVKIAPLPVTQDVSIKKLVLPKLKPSSDKQSLKQYDLLSFISPTNGSVIRNNAGSITLSASIEPGLRKEHSLRFFLDGQPVKASLGSLSVTLDNVSYGEHSASFIILDTEGKQFQSSSPIKFHLLNRINKNRP